MPITFACGVRQWSVARICRSAMPFNSAACPFSWSTRSIAPGGAPACKTVAKTNMSRALMWPSSFFIVFSFSRKRSGAITSLTIAPFRTIPDLFNLSNYNYAHTIPCSTSYSKQTCLILYTKSIAIHYDRRTYAQCLTKYLHDVLDNFILTTRTAYY